MLLPKQASHTRKAAKIAILMIKAKCFIKKSELKAILAYRLSSGQYCALEVLVKENRFSPSPAFYLFRLYEIFTKRPPRS